MLTSRHLSMIEMVRRHRVFVVLFAIGLVLRALVMIAYRPAIFYIDSFASYLAALPTLDPTGQDPIGYDILLLKPLLAIGTPATVVAVQHLLGLGMAVAGYALLLRWGAWRWLAALAVAPVLLDAYQVQIEHNIMADTLFESLVVVALVLLALPRRPGWPHALAAGLVLGVSVTVRQVGQPLIVLAVAYLLSMGRRWSKLVLPAVLVCAFAAPVLGYAAYYHHASGQWGLSRVGGNALYGRVATVADCTGLKLPPRLRQLCPDLPRDQRPGPDYWAHDAASPAARMVVPPGQTADGLLREFDRRIIARQPLAVAGAVAGDAIRVFGWGRTSGARDVPVDRWQFQREFPTFPGLVTLDSIDQMTRRYGGGPPTVVTPLAQLLRWYQLHVGFTPGPVLLLCLLVGLAGVLFGRSPPRVVCLLVLAVGVVLPLFGDVFLFSWRYQLPGFVLLPWAGGLGVTALAHRWGSRAGALAGPVSPAVGAPTLAGPAVDDSELDDSELDDPAGKFPEPADRHALADFARRYGKPEFPDVVVVIAAYNEAGALSRVLGALPRHCLGMPVTSLVIVDGATDGTATVARSHSGYVCDIPVNRGQGAALRLGYHLARAHGARFIATTDADGQYDVAELPTLLGPLVDEQADFVTGSRRLGANQSTDPVRRLGTWTFAWLVSVLTGCRITDTSFGFRAMRAGLTGQVRLTQPQYQAAELLIGALCQGARVVECPMTMRRRTQGRSKKGGNLAYGVRYARVVVGTWRRERKINRSSRANLTKNIPA